MAPMAGLAGMTEGSFFKAPGWVDQSKPPGATSQAPSYCPPYWWVKDVTGFSLFFSPNLVWLLVALADYFVFPYDMATAGRDDFFTDHRLVLGWLAWRAAVNSSITFGYFGFWHITLYWLGWAEPVERDVPEAEVPEGDG